MYDFTKCKDLEEFCYSHPLFKREMIKDLGKIRRKASEKTKMNEILDEFRAKFSLINVRQKGLTEQIVVLRESCEEVALHNQNLLMLIQESKLREKRIEGILRKYLDQFKEIPKFLLDFYQNSYTEVVAPVPVPLSHHLLTSINLSN